MLIQQTFFENIYENESSLEYMIRKIKNALRQLNSNCFICRKPLGMQSKKMRTCGQDICEFRFEENNLGNIFKEIKSDPEIAHFIIETAYLAFVSSRAADLTEPFPSFMLHNREVGRPKDGNLTHIKSAREKGIDVKAASKVQTGNKNLELGMKFIRIIYSVV